MAEAGGVKVAFDPDDTSYSRISINLTAVSTDRLKQLHRRAHWKFYGHPRRMYRIVTTLPHPSDFARVGYKHFRLKFL